MNPIFAFEKRLDCIICRKKAWRVGAVPFGCASTKKAISVWMHSGAASALRRSQVETVIAARAESIAGADPQRRGGQPWWSPQGERIICA